MSLTDSERNWKSAKAGFERISMRGQWVTAEEFAANPEMRTGFWLENGEVKADMGNAQRRHEAAKADLHEALLLRLRQLGLKSRVCSETAYRLNLYSVLIPDISVQEPPQPSGDHLFAEPPQLVIEIISPGNDRMDLRQKAKAYLAFSTDTVCIVDPQTGAAFLVTAKGEEITVFDLPLPGTDQTLDLRPLLDAWRS